MINKKNISEVVVVMLLLLVAVGIVLSFQFWGLNFSNTLYNNAEVKTEDINGLVIQNLIKDELYVKNDIEDNLAIESLKINDEDCLNGTMLNLTVGVNRVNVSGCSQNISDEIKDIVMITKKGMVVTKGKN